MTEGDARTMADAYEMIRVTHELAIEFSLSMAALINVMAEDSRFLPKFEAALEAAKLTEHATKHFQLLGHIDSVIAVLRSSSDQMGNA